jgi:hypothetical protein
MEKTIRTASNTTAAMWEDQMAMFEQLLSCCQDTRRGVSVFAADANLLLKKVEGMRINIAFQDEQRTEALHSHFKQQRKFLENAVTSFCPDKPVVSVAKPNLISCPTDINAECTDCSRIMVSHVTVCTSIVRRYISCFSTT